MLRPARSLSLAVALLAIGASAASAATLEPLGGSATPDRFDQPVFVTSDPLDSARLFVVERPGRVSEVDGDGAPRLYADLTPFVACCAGERGLLSIALAPGFHTSGRFYAAYTGTTAAGGAEGDIHVDSFVTGAGGALARTPILSIAHNQQSNHNGGQLQFGPDGDLYISTGDGGGGGDPFETGQDTSSLLAKVLRIDPHPGSTPAYSIPPGNPFGPGVAGADEVWAFGLRNPWRFSFDSLTGDMVIGDVGQAAHEEVDFAPSPSPGVVGGAGADYGWSCREGFSPYTDSTPAANCAGASGFTEPVFDYPHSGAAPGAAEGCSITGGYVVRDPTLGDLYGRYLYSDYCSGGIRSLALPSGTTPATDRYEGLTVANPTSFGEDSCHRLYVATGSEVLRFEGAIAPACPEPPGESPVGPGPAPAPVRQPTGSPTGNEAKVHLTATRRGRALLVSVRVSPCATWAGEPVRLNRGGRRVGVKPLDGDCLAVFRVAGRGRATYRALLEAGGTIRSRRLTVEPPSG